MKTTAEIIEILRDYKARSAEKYGIETLGLFGSVARGEQNEKSDIDVFIRLRKPDFIIRMKIKEELERLFHSEIDLVPLFETMRVFLRKNIEHDAIYI
ncbi:nucleotidyltransferase family protein [Parabacteroides johnsonii]|uniref:nucleotidyltransferase family protein n=1 Tax=Parabacteroides johnsonii TaxID=387661 RepID=UPI001651C914|nr:nucleotidyltransferase domain-containing protein [Parabacteroides johnsonii]MBP3641124.1 nucleotidyltransferase domain-containing protein [Parabacteroides sp.]